MAASQETEAADLRALEALVVGNADLDSLERMVNGFNLFEVMGVVRQEERHSDFLAFLLDPSESHGLGVAFLRQFIYMALSNGRADAAALLPLEAALLDLNDASVAREHQCIDVLVVSEAEKLIVLIENKIDAPEHGDQLRTYLRVVATEFVGYRVVPVFLTPDGREPSSGAYHRLDYGRVGEALGTLIDARGAEMPPDAALSVRHYIKLLERHIVSESNIADLARRIYAKHRRALDIVFENIPDATDAVRDAIIERVGTTPGLRIVYNSKAFVHFVPTAWDGLPSFASGDGTWAKSNEILRFEIENTTHLSVHLRIGPGEDAVRQRLYTATAGNAAFKNRSVSQGKKWIQLWRSTVVSDADGADLAVEERIARLNKWWVDFAATELPVLTAEMRAPLGG